MTVYRRQNSGPQEVLKAMAEFSPGQVVDLLGKNKDAIYKATNPNNPQNGLHYTDVVKLCAAMRANGQQENFVDAFRADIRAACGQVGGIPQHSPADPFDRLAEIMDRVGDAAGEVRAALCPNGERGTAVSNAERDRVVAKAAEGKEALDKLIKDMEQIAPLRGVS